MQSSPLRALAWYKKLATRKGRVAAGAFLVEGERAIEQIVTTQPQAVQEILGTEATGLVRWSYPRRQLTLRQLRSISPAQTPQGLMAVVRMPRDVYSSELPPLADIGGQILLLEHIQDPGNVGTLIRTAAAFGFAGVLLTDKCADPYAPKCVQATAGSILSVWIRRTDKYVPLVAELQARGYVLVATDLTGAGDLSSICGRNRLLMALGSEASGLTLELRQAADLRVAIPIARSRVESLNVAACGAICMFIASQKTLCTSKG